MTDLGYIKVAAATPSIKVADCVYNTGEIKRFIDEAVAGKAKVVVFPELSITGYTCGDLFFQQTLLSGALDCLFDIAKYTKDKDILAVVGLPFSYENRLYNTAAFLFDGSIIAMVPKSEIPGHSEFSENRYFASGICDYDFVDMKEEEVIPFGRKVKVTCKNIPELTIAVEFGSELLESGRLSDDAVKAGATLILNPSAICESVGRDAYRTDMIKCQSEKLYCGYVSVNAGEGESTTDTVFGGHNIIASCGSVLGELERFSTGIVFGDIDLQRITSERRRMASADVFKANSQDEAFSYFVAEIEYKEKADFLDYTLSTRIPMLPFIPEDKDACAARCEEILTIQALALKKRAEHAYAKSLVIGISGGLDSTLALLVAAKAADMLKMDRKCIYAITMPGFGTTDRTYDNAVAMIKCIGATFMKISIKDAVIKHFEDIGHDMDVHDVTYENSQARERTQILMDIANKYNGMVIGTGDMSELALGWATYNGDHMSMYGVNAAIPKTLIRYVVNYYADTTEDEKLSSILKDVIDTPVSPELIPPESGKIVQKTEDLVGPYELHDFFIFHVLRYGYTPFKVFFMAKNAFCGRYDDETILKWLKTFYRRFFAQQYKRTCVPDGPKIGSVGLSPRGDLKMPSDACSRLWLEEVERIEIK